MTKTIRRLLNVKFYSELSSNCVRRTDRRVKINECFVCSPEMRFRVDFSCTPRVRITILIFEFIVFRVRRFYANPSINCFKVVKNTLPGAIKSSVVPPARVWYVFLASTHDEFTRRPDHIVYIPCAPILKRKYE